LSYHGAIVAVFFKKENEPQRPRGHGGKKRTEKRDKVNRENV
jgi:hypothetical protein